MRFFVFIITLLVGSALAQASDALFTPPTTLPLGLGVNIHFTHPRAGEMKMLADGGFTFVRMDFDWARIEKERGKYDWSDYEALLMVLEPHHIRAVFILDYANPLYDDNRSPNTEQGREAFARWAVASANHFRSRGVIWEMYNEPNISPFWRPKPNPDDYVKLALNVGRAMRAGAPDAIYIGPACSTMDFPFLEKCFKAGLLQYWRAVSVHPYRGQAPETVAKDYRKLRGLIARYAPGKSIPVYSGEWGYSATGGIDEAEQGRRLARQWLVNISNDVPLSIWYDWHDDGPAPNENEHHFGTVAYPYHENRDPVYDPKPAYLAAKALTTQLRGYRFNKRLWLGSDDDFVLLFSRNQDVKLVAWTRSSTPHSVKLPGIATTFDVISLTGRTLPAIEPEADDLTIPLDGSPKYLVPRQRSHVLQRAAKWARVPLDVRVKAPGVAKLPADPSIPVTRGHDVIPHDVHLSVPGGTFTQRAMIIVTNPILASLTRIDSAGASVRIENPSGEPFAGSVRLRDHDSASAPVRLARNQTEIFIRVPFHPGARAPFSGAIELLDEHQHVIQRTPTMRFVPIALSIQDFTVAAEGDSKVQSTQALSPGDRAGALKLDYSFDRGWKYLLIKPKSDAHRAVEGKPRALTLLVQGDASGNYARMRFIDSTGQTFQPDGPKITWKDQRPITFPLDGSTGGHWGGANDGVIHYPIRLDAIFLLDSADRTPTHGQIQLHDATLIYGS